MPIEASITQTPAAPTPTPAPRRAVDVLVLSDLHLGTSHCQAEALERYLATVAPARVVLNGDILDLRDMKPGSWPASHGRVVARLMRFAADGLPVHYITGNHDAALRGYTPLCSGSLQLCDELVLECDGQRTLVVHGDGLEHSVPMHWILRKLGCWAYYSARRCDLLAQRLGLRWVHLVRTLQGHARVARHISDYEEACARFAHSRGFAVVVTGHIHCARSRLVALPAGSVRYLNSGDWVHSLSALEFTATQGWQVVRLSRDGQLLPGVTTRAHSGASVVAPAQEDGGGLPSTTT
jgi:UDP-2,3-diacylglucosamine pyrophosphatase LpxH